MIKVTTCMDARVEKVLSANLRCNTYGCLVVGVLVTLIYIFNELVFMKEAKWIDSLIYCSIPFLGIGIVGLIIIRKRIKDVLKLNKVYQYEFSEKYFTVNTLRKGENVGMEKVYYKDIKRFIKTKNIILIYINDISALPVDTVELTKQDKRSLLSLLRWNY